MAAGGPTVTLTFAGNDRNLSKTLSSLTKRLNSTQNALRNFRGAAISGLVTSLPYAAGAVAGLSGVLGLLPSAAFAGGLALGALAIGTQGFGEALKNLDDPAKFAEALEKLSPAARSTALAIKDLKPQFDGLRLATQDALFAGMSDQLRTLSGALLPTLQSQLVTTAGSINAAAKGFMSWLSAPSTITDINTALDGSRGFLDGILRSITPVSKALLDIGVVAAPYIRRLGDIIAQAAVRFQEFIAAARGTGQLNEWIRQGVEVFSQLWNVITTVGQAIWNLAVAFGSSGFPSMLQLVANGLLMVSQFVRENNAVMVPLITTIGILVATFKTIMGVVAIINAIRSATMLWTAAQWLLNAAFLANPITWIVLGIMALIAAIILCIVYWDQIKAAAIGAVNWIVAKWNEAVAWLAGIWNSIKATAISIWNAVTQWIAGKVAQAIAFIHRLSQIPGQVGAWFNDMRNRAVAAAGALVNWLSGLPGRIMSAIGSLGSLLVSAGRDLVNGLWNGIKAGWAWITSAVRNLASSLLSAAKSALGIASPSKLFRDQVGHEIADGLAQGILNSASLAIDAARSVGEQAAAAAQQAVSSRQVAVKWGSIGEAQWTRLLDMGYRGRAGDNQEALYVPQGVLDQVTGRSSSSYSSALSGASSGRSYTQPATYVTLNVQGSILSERQLVSIIRNEMDRGGFRGVRN